MKSKIQNLSERLKSIRMETNIIRTETFKVIDKLLSKGNGRIVVPINPTYAKKDAMSDADKQYNSVILDSYPVEYRENGNVRNAYILGLKKDNEGLILAMAYDSEFTKDKIVEFPVDEIVNIEPLVSFVLDFAADAEEPEK